MGLCGAGCGTGAGGALDRAQTDARGFGNSFEARKHKTGSAHVARLFLYPHDFARVGMFGDSRGDFCAGHWVELVQEKDGGARIFAAAPFRAQFVAHFAAGDQDAVNSSMEELASGCRSMLFGVNTMSGLRHGRRA